MPGAGGLRKTSSTPRSFFCIGSQTSASFYTNSTRRGTPPSTTPLPNKSVPSQYNSPAEEVCPCRRSLYTRATSHPPTTDPTDSTYGFI